LFVFASRKAETVLASSQGNRNFCPHDGVADESSVLWDILNFARTYFERKDN
jgi:hypothetical protein